MNKMMDYLQICWISIKLYHTVVFTNSFFGFDRKRISTTRTTKNVGDIFEKFIYGHRSENIRFVCGGARSVGCEIGSKSIFSLHDILNL